MKAMVKKSKRLLLAAMAVSIFVITVAMAVPQCAQAGGIIDVTLSAEEQAAMDTVIRPVKLLGLLFSAVIAVIGAIILMKNATELFSSMQAQDPSSTRRAAFGCLEGFAMIFVVVLINLLV